MVGDQGRHTDADRQIALKKSRHLSLKVTLHEALVARRLSQKEPLMGLLDFQDGEIVEEIVSL
jgi:hypothetical protein